MTFRPLPAWPYEPQKRRPATYQSTYQATLYDLEDELRLLRASEVILGVVCPERDVRLDGQLRANARPEYPGVELSFETPDRGRLTFHTDRHRTHVDSWQDNLRAIVLGLRALRAVERYGISETGQQYAGFVALPANVKASRGQALVEQHGGFTAALKATHPDHGGDASDFDAVRTYQREVG